MDKCLLVQNVQKVKKYTKYAKFCKMCNVVKNCKYLQICAKRAKFCSMCKKCKIVQSVLNCAICAKLCKVSKFDICFFFSFHVFLRFSKENGGLESEGRSHILSVVPKGNSRHPAPRRRRCFSREITRQNIHCSSHCIVIQRRQHAQKNNKYGL